MWPDGLERDGATRAPLALECDALPVPYGSADTRRVERRDVDSTAEPGQARNDHPRPPDRPGPLRQRGEPGNVPGGSPGRLPPDTRRKRGNDHRYACWGDGIERVYCASAAHFLPEGFPVASHAGAATIPATVVARQVDRLLLCTFSHHGPHVWPDGELVGDGSAMPSATNETP
jgi:hypothetical protein